MLQRRSLILSALLAVMTLPTIAQPVIHFNEGLYVPSGSRYGREALYADLLAYQLYSQTLVKPAAGVLLGMSAQGDSLIWRPVKADSANRFAIRRWETINRGNTFGNPNRVDRGTGYLYLTYNSPKATIAVLNVKGNSGVYINGAPHMGDPYSAGYMYIPVMLKKGLNEFYVRGTNVVADLIFPSKPAYFLTDDLTLPTIVPGQDNSRLVAALVVMNASEKPLQGMQIRSSVAGKEVITLLPDIPAMTSRKVPFQLDGSAIQAKGNPAADLALLVGGKQVDNTSVKIESVNAGEQYTTTFTSQMDGSLQYYAVTPQLAGTPAANQALFLSVHGAGVEAIGQARAYRSKDWGTVVAATNRRPRGFNWEDWGRLDALEVLALAKQKFQPDPLHIYLTGHSMGGHGTWFLGATYPDKWAAIGPAAGYPTLKSYGSADGVIPDSSTDAGAQMLLRSSNQSDVPKLAQNYKPLGVYILHGDADRVVPVQFARQMREQLGGFHADYSYYEYPGGEHWFGNQSVDWKPMFDFFKWHARKADTAVHNIDFTTSSPGISASFRWAAVYQQEHPLQYSRIVLNREMQPRTISGNTTNVSLLKLQLADFGPDAKISIRLDSTAPVSYTTRGGADSIFLRKTGKSWAIVDAPATREKGPHRYGTFKDAFNYRMVLVYGTTGTKEENDWSYQKAVYDAETWYYRGNGAVDIVSDKAFLSGNYKDRGVVLFGNAATNAAWSSLLADCPIQVDRNKITAGTKTWQGDDLCAYFVWPRKDSEYASVGVVTGSGLKGMKAANANQYYAGASGFPDFMVYRLDLLKSGAQDLKAAGFYSNNWELQASEAVFQD